MKDDREGGGGAGMKALTIWQPWASLIMAGVKLYEFRGWPAPRSVVDRRIVIHAGARKVRTHELAELLEDRVRRIGSLGAPQHDGRALDLLERAWRSPDILPIAVGLGTVVFGEPRKAQDVFAGEIGADDIDPDIWAWPVSDPQPFESPVPARGAQGFWKWSAAA